MSSPSGLRARVLAREWLGGTFINLGSPITAEIAAHSGFGWLLLDYEHGPGSEETLLHQLQAISGTGTAAVVRIAANETTRFKRALDLGADGVMVPYVNTEAEARAAVAAARFPPHGVRGVSKFNRAAGFGRRFDHNFAHAHEEMIVIAQIETPEALSNLDAIAAVDGIDVLFLGPLDLTANLGIVAEFEHPKFTQARADVAAAALRHGKAAGILLAHAGQVADARRDGYTVVALGSDGGAVVAGLQQNAAALKPAIAPK
jgi:2-keto-3-deoxy-L-rhamnonate aldolase RhmA